MNKLLITVAAAGLLLSLPAIAESTNTDQKSDTPAASGTQTINPNEGRLQDDRGGQVKTGSEQRQGHARRHNDQRSTVRRDRQDNRVREGVSVRGRSTTGMAIHETNEFRRGPGIHVGFGHDHCRRVIVESRHHGHVVIRHIRRCY